MTKLGKNRLKGGGRDMESRRGSQNWQPCLNCQSPILSLGGCDKKREPRETRPREERRLDASDRVKDESSL